MNLADAVQRTSEKTGENNNRIRLILNAFFEEIRDELAQGGEVKVPHFGEFYSKKVAPREVTSPFLNGETKRIASYRAVRFKPSATLKRYVREGH